MIFLTIITLTSSWNTRRYVKSGPLWLGDFKDVLSPNWNKNMGPLQKRKGLTSVMNVDTLNVVIPSKPTEKHKNTRKNSNILRMCSFSKGCKNNRLKEERLNQLKEQKYLKALQAMQDVLAEKDDSAELKMCPCSEGHNGQNCKCKGLRSGPSSTNQHLCNCGAFDYNCKLKCQKRTEETAVLKVKRCGCSRNDYTCLEKCFNNDKTTDYQIARCGCNKTDRICLERCVYEAESRKKEFVRCGCDKTDRTCQERCLNRFDLPLRSFLRCGCGKSDRMCQNRCFNNDDSHIRTFLRCGCSKTDRICQDRCLNHDDTALQSFLRCGCGKTDRICQNRCFDSENTATKLFLRCGCRKTDRMCQERCLQSDVAVILNHLRCGCNVSEFACLDRCARDELLESDSNSEFLDCGCNFNDYACRVRCDSIANGWRKPNNRICNCENFDHECKEKCARHKKQKDSFDSLIAEVATNGKRYKINNDIDVVVYDPMNLAHILGSIKFNNNKIRDNQGLHILPVMKYNNNDSSNEGVELAVKPVTKIDINERVNKGKSQEIDKVLKELQDAKMVEFDIGNVQTVHNGKFQNPKPKFVDMLLEFATKIKNATSKLSENVHTKASIANKNIKQGHYRISSGTNEDDKKRTSNFEEISLQAPNNFKYSQKKDDGALAPLYEILRSGPDGDVESRNKNRDEDSRNENRDEDIRNENRDDGMNFANDVVKSLQDYLYSRRRGREKRRKDDDHDPHHPHQKHSLLPLTKRQKMKRLNWQVGGRSLVKFRRNLQGDKIVTYGAPFELDIKGMGQVNFVEAIQLLNA